MYRFRGALALASLASLLVLAPGGAVEARDLKVKRTAAAPKAVEQKTAVVAAPTKPAEVAPAPTPVAATVPACARKVKVIYAGYGEADRAACTQSAANEVGSAVIATR